MREAQERSVRANSVEVAVLDRRVRLEFAGQLLADSERVLRVIENPHEVRYYLPRTDVDQGFLVDERRVSDHAGRGPAIVWTVAAGGTSAADGAWSYPDFASGRPDLRGYLCFAWHALDRMLEEDQEVSVHPRSPYIRVEVLASRRHICIEYRGMLLAETTGAQLLVETYQANRWYIPRGDLRVHLQSSSTRTECPYKGLAAYWSLRLDVPDHSAVEAPDIAWSYPYPGGDPAILALTDSVAFDPTRIDTRIDGRYTRRPTPAPTPAHLVGDWVRRRPSIIEPQ